MLNQTFLKWLAEDIVAVKYSLLVALEERDNLIYIEEPQLKEEYMQKIGVYEEQVLKLELEVSLQEKKKQMIQTAINRRDEINLDEIDRLLEEERLKQLEKLNRTFKVGRQEQSNLTEEEKSELKRLYGEIVSDFHPQVHTDITENQKILYQKALEAYKQQNLERMHLIHDMLYSDDLSEIELELSLKVTVNKEKEEWDSDMEVMMEDYSLAQRLYPYFEALEEEGIILSAKTRYREEQEMVLAEIDGIYNRFPFIAKDTLRNEDKLKSYLDSLFGRRGVAEERIKELQEEITIMIREKG